jgi:DNA-binding transcriptional MerR regulator
MARNRRKLFYKIGEVCRICEIEPHVVRYWETVFSRLKPVKNRSGQRIYRRNDLELIETIKSLLYEQGYTIAPISDFRRIMVRRRTCRCSAAASRPDVDWPFRS